MQYRKNTILSQSHADKGEQLKRQQLRATFYEVKLKIGAYVFPRNWRVICMEHFGLVGGTARHNCRQREEKKRNWKRRTRGKIWSRQLCCGTARTADAKETDCKRIWYFDMMHTPCPNSESEPEPDRDSDSDSDSAPDDRNVACNHRGAIFVCT